MSTHCQLQFQRLNDDPEDPTVAQVFRHSNSAPPLVLDALQRLQLVLRTTRSDRGPSYAAAAFMHQETCRMMSAYLDVHWGPSIDAPTPAVVLDV